MKKLLIVLLCFGFLGVTSFSLAAKPAKKNLKRRPAKPTQEKLIYIDTHEHLTGHFGPPGKPIIDFDGAAETALKEMDSLGIKKILIMPTPQPVDLPNAYTIEDFINTVNRNTQRFGFLGGGGSLNVMVQQAIHDGEVSSELRSEFRQRALEILKKGALGFGEMAVEHISMDPNHPYVTASPDHELFLLLADIAAEHNVPIDIHMEAVPEDMRLPNKFNSPPNPKILKANIAAFARLLGHNRNAKIIWAHVGWDNTGFRTVELMRELLNRNSNLYMSLRVATNDKGSNSARAEDGKIRTEWRQLISDFPDRFMIGSDEFFLSPKMKKKSHASTGSTKATVNILKQLPDELARKVGYENAERIFKID